MSEWYIKSYEETDPRFGKEPEKRSIEEAIRNAVIILDKHSGPTSHQITLWVKEIFGVKKAGHAGTLDPKVTGVLPIALENALKAMPLLMGLDKEYVGVMHLHKDIDIENVKKTIVENFIGEIVQVPPRKSAVARRPRKKKIYYFDILEVDGRDVLFKVGCQAGVYIRKLIHDLGKKLKIGAHMKELRRTKAGPFEENQAIPLLEVKDRYEIWKEEENEKPLREILLQVEYALPHVKKVFVKDSAIWNIANGAPVYASGLVRIQKGILPNEYVAIYSLKNELIAIGIAKMTSEEMFEKKEGIAIRTDRVFISKDVYPRKIPK
ncbi:MAG: RNA-guided pseudouridylation complex pseudouridine synthase subunit Cbf5 [Candidatus Aenigmarchaeota archaeon ex4484_224]|nr:MAG: RNA-guided pseudouridylation complex pseudouridine synthase subunit Cbf5 [Candidatus Aenigmarchaeota archaeon ex4484_224]